MYMEDSMGRDGWPAQFKIILFLSLIILEQGMDLIILCCNLGI